METLALYVPLLLFLPPCHIAYFIQKWHIFANLRYCRSRENEFNKIIEPTSLVLGHESRGGGGKEIRRREMKGT